MTSHFTIENLTPTDWPNICTNNYNLSLSHANFFSLFPSDGGGGGGGEIFMSKYLQYPYL